LILGHPGVLHERLNKSKYLLSCNGSSWYLWPRSGRHQRILPGGELSDLFISELDVFYQRYITGELDLPENFGKVWSENDKKLLYEMIDHGCSLNAIAGELKRHPTSIVSRLSMLLDDNGLDKWLTPDLYDVALLDLIDN